MSDFLYRLNRNTGDFNGGTANVVPAPTEARLIANKAKGQDAEGKAYRYAAKIPRNVRWGAPYSFTSWSKFHSNTLYMELEVASDRTWGTRYPRADSERVLRAIDTRNRNKR